MPFRERLKKTFSRSGSGSDTSSTLSRTMTNDSQQQQPQQARRASNVYQPGEKMPPLKYRRPVTKEHKELLEAFDFSTAWRRRSHHSIYSPHGSRQASRAPSIVMAMTDADASLTKNENAGSDTSISDAASDDSSISAATSSAASDLLVEKIETWSFS